VRIANSRKLNEQGQTLVDLMIALALLALASASAGALATASAHLDTESGQRSQAVALAEREVEGLRDYRQNQELANVTGPTFATMWTNCSAGCVMNRAGNAWTLTPEAAYTPYSGAGGTNGGDASLGTATYGGFSRLITIRPYTETVPRRLVTWSR
jgi:hypothetical protein